MILFFFSQLNALDVVPLSEIITIEVNGNELLFKIVDSEGNRIEKRRPITRFVANQIKDFALEVYGDNTKLTEALSRSTENVNTQNNN
mgnify:CR=1 FL=1